jgi:GT2 family glycosyltransferase
VSPAPTVRAVVVTWNGAHLLPLSLGSLAAQVSRARLDVVVVDNGSQDGTDDLLARDFPAVRVLRSERNLGFAGGAALGTADLDTDYVLLLNNDARLLPDALDAMLDVAEADERVGAVTAKVLLDEPGDGPRRVNSTGNVVTRAGAGMDRDWLVQEGEESTDPDVFGFCGAAALLRRSALDEVGTFDPWLFLYYEDTDLSWRLRAAGWLVRYAPAAVALHRHAASSDTASPLFRYHNTRNSLVVLGRYAPASVVAASAARQCAGWLRAVLRAPADPVTRARGRGLRDAAVRLPRTLRERRGLWSGAAVPLRDVARLLVRGQR